MSSDTRKPGPVGEKARPLNGSASVEDVSDMKMKDHDNPRTPGPVPEPTEVMEVDNPIQEEEDLPLLPELTESSPWKIFFALLVLCFVVWLLSEVAVTLLQAYREQVAWIWLPLAVVTITAIGAFVWAARREYKAIRSVDVLAEREQQIQSMIEEKNLSGLRQVLAPTLENLRRRNPALIRKFEEAASERDTPEDYLSQFENLVLTQLDAEAKKVTKQCVLSGSLAIAISPHPTLDTFFVLWRARVLVRNVCEIYGLQPTGFSAFRLMKHAVTSAMIAAAMEKSGEIVLSQVAENVALRAFKPVAEGTTTALRLYRLGLITQQICRPVPVKFFQEK